MSNDLVDELHARAGLGLLIADPGLTVYEGFVPNGFALPYVLVYTSVEWPEEGEGQSFDATTSTCVTHWYTHSAAVTEQAARAVAGRVRGRLVNVRPDIPGRSCCLIQQESSLPAVRDQTTGTTVFDIVAAYVLTTFENDAAG